VEYVGGVQSVIGVGRFATVADISKRGGEMKKSSWVTGCAIFATIFGLLTIISGGRVLVNPEAQQEAGNYVSFVLWFNFLAGFAYITAAVGLWYLKRWAIWLSFAIAVATVIVFAILGLHIMTGGAFEMRTVGAMSLRTVVWFVISAIAYQNIVFASKN
jgi:hypothetical protein